MLTRAHLECTLRSISLVLRFEQGEAKTLQEGEGALGVGWVYTCIIRTWAHGGVTDCEDALPHAPDPQHPRCALTLDCPFLPSATLAYWGLNGANKGLRSLSVTHLARLKRKSLQGCSAGGGDTRRRWCPLGRW